MTLLYCHKKKIKEVIFLCLILMPVIFGQTPRSSASEITGGNVQNILRDSLEDLWTGREFSPALLSRQKTLQSMLASDAINKTELAGMLQATTISIMNRHRTSRYTLQEMPERVNALFSDSLDWQQMRIVIWRAISSTIDNQTPFTIKVGTLAPPGTPWLSVPENTVISDIEKLSEGKIRIQIYGSGVMGEDPDVLKKMKSNQLDGCGCTALGVLAACPEASVLLLPGLFKNYDEVDFICAKFRKRLDRAFEERGYLLTALIDTGFFNIFLKNYATGLADIESQKIQTWFGTLETHFYEELGIKAVPVRSPETVSGLSSGRINATLSPAAWMLGMQAYQYVKFYFTPPLLYSPAAVITSTDIKNRLRQHIGASEIFAHNFRELLLSEFIALEPEWKHQIRAYESKSIKAFETKCGMQALAFSPEDMALIEKAGRSVARKLAGKVISADLTHDIQKALSDYRKTRNP